MAELASKQKRERKLSAETSNVKFRSDLGRARPRVMESALARADWSAPKREAYRARHLQRLVGVDRGASRPARRMK